jgi:hypothetical protein
VCILLVVYVGETLELVHLSDNSTEPTMEQISEFENLYGEGTVFDYFNESSISYSEFADFREKGEIAIFGVELVGGSPNFNLTRRIYANLDKPEILANGIDTATITATVDDATSTETIELYNGATLVDSKPCVAGSATFLVTMSEMGALTLTVNSTTKYGQRDVTIEGV